MQTTKIFHHDLQKEGQISPCTGENAEPKHFIHKYVASATG